MESNLTSKGRAEPQIYSSSAMKPVKKKAKSVVTGAVESGESIQ
jgi:hypothetical protein